MPLLGPIILSYLQNPTQACQACLCKRYKISNQVLLLLGDREGAIVSNNATMPPECSETQGIESRS